VERSFEEVEKVLEQHGFKSQNLVSILQGVQGIYGYLPEDAMDFIAKKLGITGGHVFGVATFYSHFTLTPKGKYIIKVCDGTACHVRKSTDIIKTIQSELGLSDQKNTSDDGLFTLEAVACLGACGLAPVLTVNDEVYGAMTIVKTKELLDRIKKTATAT